MSNTTLANPAPLGLMGFGMTTILLNLHNTGLFAMDVIILAMGIFYGGIAQIFAGLLEYKKGNTFGLTAFTSYGSFWLTLVAILLLPKLGLAEAADGHFLGAYLALWGRVHCIPIFRHAEVTENAAVHLRQPDAAVCAAGYRPPDRQRGVAARCRLDWHYLRFECVLSGDGRSAEREVWSYGIADWRVTNE